MISRRRDCRPRSIQTFYDFIRCEYIENTPTAYIDTLIKGSDKISIQLKYVFKKNSNSTVSGFIFGSRIANNDRQYGIINSYVSQFRFGNTTSSTAYITDTDILVTLDNTENHYELKILDSSNNLLHTLTTTNNSFSNNLNLYIFGINNNGSLIAFSDTTKLYSCKIYDGETIVRDFIPMYQISTDTYGLWDRVENKFYTSPNGVKFKGSLLFIDEYLKGMCQSYADSEGRIDYKTLANSPFGEYKTKLVNKLKWVDFTPTFNKDVKIYGVKSVNTQRLAECTVRFYINGTKNHIGLYIFYKRWGYYNNSSSAYNNIANIWTNYDGFYYTIYLDTRSKERNVKYLQFYTINGYKPEHYKSTMVDVLVNIDDI